MVDGNTLTREKTMKATFKSANGEVLASVITSDDLCFDEARSLINDIHQLIDTSFQTDTKVVLTLSDNDDSFQRIISAVIAWAQEGNLLSSWGICRNIVDYVKDQTGIWTAVELTDVFLKNNYPEYSGYASFPVPAPDGTCPIKAYMGTVKGEFLTGEYGESRKRLLEVVCKHIPTVKITASRGYIITY